MAETAALLAAAEEEQRREAERTALAAVNSEELRRTKASKLGWRIWVSKASTLGGWIINGRKGATGA